MGCGCGGGAVQALNSQEVNAMLAAAQQEAQQAAKSEIEAMVASAQQAAANASSGSGVIATQQ